MNRLERIAARKIIQAETSLELAERVVIRKRKELSAYLSAYKRKREKERKEHIATIEKEIRKLAKEKKWDWKKKIWKKMQELEDSGLSDDEVRDKYNQWKRTGRW